LWERPCSIRDNVAVEYRCFDDMRVSEIVRSLLNFTSTGRIMTGRGKLEYLNRNCFIVTSSLMDCCGLNKDWPA
jgi:hypothetical protein